MPIVAENQVTESIWLKYEEGQDSTKGITRSRGVIGEASDVTIVTGTVMGKVTASGKWKVAKAGASDGSEVVAGVFVNGFSNLDPKIVSLDVVGGVDAGAVILDRGTAIVAKDALVIDASYTNKEVVYAALKALQINTTENV